MLLSTTFFCVVSADFSDDFDTKPKIRVNYLSQNSDQIETFLGNQTHRDHFKLLRSDGVSLLIGARNVVYNLSLADLKENVDQRITWPSRQSEREMCLIKGKSEDECQNYIRVLAQTDTRNLLVCGTNSYKPKCRTYTTLPEITNDASSKKASNGNKAAKAVDVAKAELKDDDEEEGGPFFQMKHEFSGTGICPHDPRHNSTAIFADGELYSGTTADFSGSDALIYRDGIRTEQNDLRHLNAPDFVSSVEDEDHVYFFFRETAVEYINCGKTIYSRVGRVCKNDRGGSQRGYRQKWTTFMKSRLNCSIPGEFPFYFDEIQGTSNLMGKDQMIYGVFTTPPNSISGSAVCAFKLSDVLATFDSGDFKGRASTESNWLPVRPPTKSAGSCSADSKSLPESTLNFMKSHSLMDGAVGNVYAAPLFVKTAVNERLTVIAVDPEVRTPADGKTYDVMYVGTSRGKVLKVISVEDDTKTFDHKKDVAHRKPVVIEEMQVFPYHVPVANVQVVKAKKASGGGSAEKKKLVVLSGHEVKALPLHRCKAARVQSCKACVALQDPHCAWNLRKRKCVDSTTFTDATSDASALLQDVVHGKHAACSSSDAAAAFAADEDDIKADGEVVSGLRNSRPKSVQPLEEVSDNQIDITEEEEDEEQEDEIDIVIDFQPDQDDYDEDYPYYEGRELNSADEIVYTEAAMTTATTVTAFVALLVGLVSGALLQRKCSKDGYRNCGHHYLEQQAHINKQHETSGLHHGRSAESGYTSAPVCNNLTASTTSSSSSNTTSSTASSGSSSSGSGNCSEHKNSNLLVNLATKSDPEKNNIGSSSSGGTTNSTATPSETTIIYNGTIPRNGTLCKKVYL